MHWSTGIVLIVDPEDEVLEILKTALESTDYVLMQAKTGDEALAVLSRLKSHIDLTIIDLEYTLRDCKINGNRARNVVGYSHRRDPDEHSVRFVRKTS